MRRLAWMPLLLLLGGCTMIPKMTRPEAPVAAQWDGTPPLEAETTTSAADTDWRNFFQSERLRAVLTTTLANNRDLRIAALNVEAARALYRIERADRLPQVDALGGAVRQRSTRAQNPDTDQAFTFSEYSANVASTSFELDFFGRVRSLNEAALQRYFAGEAARDTVQISLIAETANAYLQWSADLEILALTQETLSAQEQSRDLIDQRQKAGVASKLDLAQVRIAVAAAEANQALYRRRVLQDRNALQLLMGTAETDPIGQGEPLAAITVLDQLPVGLPSEVLLQRPDIRGAEHALNAANADIGAARAAFFPRITLTGSLGFASSDLGDLFSSAGAGAWRFVPQISMPLFNNGRNKANLAYTEIRKEALVAEYERAIQIAFREVADVLAARQTLDTELAAQRSQIKAAGDAYELAYARYKSGVDSFLSALDAQRILFEAQRRAIETEKLRLANLVQLYKTLGGGA